MSITQHAMYGCTIVLLIKIILIINRSQKEEVITPDRLTIWSLSGVSLSGVMTSLKEVTTPDKEVMTPDRLVDIITKNTLLYSITKFPT